MASAKETLQYGSIRVIRTVQDVLVSYSLNAGGHSSQLLQCLPDTVDPRYRPQEARTFIKMQYRYELIGRWSVRREY